MTQEFFHSSEEDPRLHKIEGLMVGRQWERAEIELRTIVERDPEHAAAWLYLADLYLADNKWHKALDASANLHRLFGPEDPRPYVASGCARARLGRFHIALRDLREADRIASGHPEVIRNIGWIECMLGRKKEGRANLERSISIDPTNISTYVDLAMSFHFSGDYLHAIKWLRKAFALDPENAFVLEQERMIVQAAAHFKKLTPAKQKASRAVLNNAQAHHDTNIRLLLHGTSTPPTINDLLDIKEELKLGNYRETVHIPEESETHLWNLEITR